MSILYSQQRITTYAIDFSIGIAEYNLPDIEFNAKAIIQEVFHVAERVAFSNNRPNSIDRNTAVFITGYD